MQVRGACRYSRVVKKTKLVAYAALAGAMLFFAASYSLIKLALRDLGPFTLGITRFILTAVLLIGYFAITRRWQRPTRADLRLLAIGGLLGFTLFFAVQNLGVELATATDATLLGAAFPAIVAVLDVILNKAKISGRAWLGIGITILGALGVILGAPGRTEAASHRPWGIALLMLSGVIWALYIFRTREVVQRYSATTTVMWQTGIGAIGFLPLMAMEVPQWHLPQFPLATTVAVALLTVGCSIFAMIWYTFAVRHLPTTMVAASQNLVPIFGVVIALIVLHEQVTVLQVLGGVIVLVGISLTAPKDEQSVAA